MDPLSRRVTVTMQPERATGWHNASLAPPQRTLKPNYAPFTLSDPAFTQIRPLEPAPNSIQEYKRPPELPCFHIVSGGGGGGGGVGGGVILQDAQQVLGWTHLP